MIRRRRLQAILTITASVLCALGLAEGLLRLFWTPPALRTTIAFRDHPYYGWAPLPGLRGVRVSSEFEHEVTHTAQGFRGKRIFRRERPEGIEKRVLFLGDSFTYGIGSGDDEIFPALFDQAWPRVEVANGGCNAYGTHNALAVLDRFGAAFRPDLTVLVFFWNDLEDNNDRKVPDFRFDEEGRVVRADPLPDGEFDPMAEQPPAEGRVRSSWNHFHLQDVIRTAVRGFHLRVWGIKPRSIQTDADLQKAWTATDRMLVFMAARAKELGTTLVVAPMPDHNQINPNAIIKNINPLNYEVQERLAEICERIGVRCIDVRPAMHESWKRTGVDYYYYADRHLTPEGNREFTRLLRKELEPILFGDDG